MTDATLFRVRVQHGERVDYSRMMPLPQAQTRARLLQSAAAILNDTTAVIEIEIALWFGEEQEFETDWIDTDRLTAMGWKWLPLHTE